MNVNTFKNYVKVLSLEGKPFYASDVNLCGGEIKGLKMLGLIEPTGNTKKVSAIIEKYDGEKDCYCKVPFEFTAKEWVAREPENPFGYYSYGSWNRRLSTKIANELLQNLEALQFLASILD